ncbi:MAG: hypothetical protein ACPKMZ_09880 [Pleomorphochaeta sp.]
MKNKTNFFELFNLINKINVYGEENIEFIFSYKETSKNLLINNSVLFDDNILIDDEDFEFDSLPESGNVLQAYTHPDQLSKYSKVLFFLSMEDLYKEFIINEKSVIGSSQNNAFLYLIIDESDKGATLYEFSELPNKVKNILENKFILSYLKTIADYDMGNDLLFLSKDLIKLNIDLNLKDVTSVLNYSYIKEYELNKNEATKRIFISILYKKLNSVEYNKRLKFFFKHYDEIMNEYKINSQIYYSDFDIFKIHNYLDNKWLEINQKIKDSINNLKGEALLIISGGLSVTKLGFGNDELGFYSLIVLFIVFFIGAVIYNTFFKVDIYELKYIKDILIKNIEEYIQKIDSLKEEKLNIKEINLQIGAQKNNINNKIILFWLCRIISFFPVLLIVIEIIKLFYFKAPPSTPSL